MRRKVIIIIPTYNESANIKRLLKAIFQLEIEEIGVLVVDDNSPDGTADIVQGLAKHYPVSLLSRAEKNGLGTAYIAGFKQALNTGADYIFQMDADLSHDPVDIPRLLSAMKDADLAIGSRKVSNGTIIGWSAIRKGMSHGAMIFSRMLLGLKTKDVTAGFRCFHRRVLEHIPLTTISSNGYAFQEELLYRTEQANFRVKEIPVTFVDRQEGKSKLSRRDIIEFFVVMMKLRFGK